MSQTEKHETILLDSQQNSDEMLEPVQQRNQFTITIENTSPVPGETTTDTHSIIITTDSNILNFPVYQTTENHTNLFHNPWIHKIQILHYHKHYLNKSKALKIHLQYHLNFLLKTPLILFRNKALRIQIKTYHKTLLWPSLSKWLQQDKQPFVHHHTLQLKPLIFHTLFSLLIQFKPIHNHMLQLLEHFLDLH